MAANSEKDAGFCSGGDEDDNMSGLHSPSASEDSVEVQVTPISLRNKRKLAEPRKIQEPNMAPLKKRRFELIERATGQKMINESKSSCGDSLEMPIVQDEESRPASSPSPSPFRPWSSPATSKSHSSPCSNNNNKEINVCGDRKVLENQEDVQDNSRLENQDPEILRRHDEDRWIEEENKRREEETRRRYEARIQEEVMSRLHESDHRRLHHRHHHQHHNHLQNHDQRARPLSPISPQLIATPPRSASVNSSHSTSQRRESHHLKHRFETAQPTSLGLAPNARLQEEPLSLVLRSGEAPRVPSHPGVNGSYERSSAAGYISDSLRSSPLLQNGHQTPGNSNSRHPTSPGQTETQQQQQQRNYKNMTRERRIEANARERTRVHTISAAFDTLRRAVPAYSNNQKLSKLSVLRIACSYIMTLSNIVNTPEGEPTTSPSLGACVDLVSRTIQTEGKLRKKKDE